MLISTNDNSSNLDFQRLLDTLLLSLKSDALSNPSKYLLLSGSKLESRVFEILKENARNTKFDGTIELISGQRFPDIIANKYYGIEVKTTTKPNSWKSTGSSILESTRVEGIEKIYMLFGKICDPIEFKCRPYEECLSEVVVTHSPRYLIDMNLAIGDTIFDKIEVPYDILRRETNPIRTVLNYYKKHLKPGDNLWYLEQENGSSNGTNLIIKMWNNLTPIKRNDYMILGFCLFPEIFGNRTDKFNAFALWLATREAIICPNIRDTFTAGGQGNIVVREKPYLNNPQIIVKLSQSLTEIKGKLLSIPHEDLESCWGTSFEEENRYSIWKKLVIQNSSSIIKNGLPLEEIL